MPQPYKVRCQDCNKKYTVTYAEWRAYQDPYLPKPQRCPACEHKVIELMRKA